MNAGIGETCTKSLKGYFVSRGLDLCCCCVRYTSKRTFENSFKVVCLQSFFFQCWGKENIHLCGNVKVTVDIQKGTGF